MATFTGTIDLTFVPQLTRGVIYRRSGNGAISVMQLDNQLYFFKVEGMVISVWNLIDGKRSLKIIIAKVAKDNEVLPAKIMKQTIGFIRDLINANLVKRPKADI